MYRNLQGKGGTLSPRPAFCASLHILWIFTREMPHANFAQACTNRNAHGHLFTGAICVEINRENARILCEPAQSKCTWTLHKSHFVKVPNANPGAIVLCKPGLHIEKKLHLDSNPVCVWKFTGKTPNANPGASILREPAQSKHNFTRTTLSENLQGKSQRLILGPEFCVSRHHRNAHNKTLHKNNFVWNAKIPGRASCASLHS